VTTLQYLIETYGYIAVFVGTFLEGETILVMAGLAAHLGYLDLRWVIATAFFGSLSGDQLYFYLGRWRGMRLFRRFPYLRRRAFIFRRLLHRYHAPIIVVIRFLYGLRIVGPIAIGMSRVPALRFLLFNVTGALIWAVVIAGIGYLFGEALERVLGHIRDYEVAALAVFALLGVIVWGGYRLWSRDR
jgi:membrane protein DedA with SNARE-associated domain